MSAIHSGRCHPSLCDAAGTFRGVDSELDLKLVELLMQEQLALKS